MNNNITDLTYNQAVEELDGILQRIEDDAIDVDELTQSVKRASELIKLCKRKLRNAESAISQVFEEIDCDPDLSPGKDAPSPLRINRQEPATGSTPKNTARFPADDELPF
jgi:exodeoxyribonuclease VII small subunit